MREAAAAALCVCVCVYVRSGLQILPIYFCLLVSKYTINRNVTHAFTVFNSFLLVVCHFKRHMRYSHGSLHNAFPSACEVSDRVNEWTVGTTLY